MIAPHSGDCTERWEEPCGEVALVSTQATSETSRDRDEKGQPMRAERGRPVQLSGQAEQSAKQAVADAEGSWGVGSGIVLRGRESRPHGEGPDGSPKLAKDHERMRQAGRLMQASLRGIANKARLDKKHRFRNLFGLLNEEGLESCWRLLNKKAASGVDGVTAREYARDLAGNIRRLVESVKHGRYRARLVRRKDIPKDGKSTRPLGLLVLQDKLLQKGAARILEAIFEAEFLPCSWAYRQGRNALGAVRTLTQELQFGCYGYVIKVDIKGFFENIDHEWMMRMLRERIDDRPFLRLILKWLKAGVMEEDGRVRHPLTGCPQGGVISPILANIYLHCVLDLWFERCVRPNTFKRAFMCRYADDMVFAFQIRSEAYRFHQELIKRLAEFGLEVSLEKTQIIRFNKHRLKKQAKSFEFLGFEFRWMKDRSGTPRVKRRTSPKRLRRAIARTTEWCKSQRNSKTRKILAAFNRKLLGHFNYYGVRCNFASLQAFYIQAKCALYKWLNRRSQRRSYSWSQFNSLIRRFRIARPRIRADRYLQLDLFGEAC